MNDILVGVPEVFLVGAPDLDDVAETLGGHHRRAREPARDQRVGRDRGPVREQRDLGEVDPGLGHTAHDPVDRIGGRRRLLNADEAGCLVHDADIGKGAADVDGHAKVLHRYDFLIERCARENHTQIAGEALDAQCRKICARERKRPWSWTLFS